MSKKMPKHGDFCWNELMTPDVKQSKEFYHGLFGWTFDDMDVGQMIYSMIKSADKNAEDGVGGLLPTPEDMKHLPSHWLSYVSVDNVDDTLEKAQSLGANIRVPATNIADYGRFAVIQDPVGAVVAIWQSLKTCD